MAGSNWLKWSAERICDRLSWNEKTLRRTINRSIELGLLSYQRQRRADGRYGIAWLKIYWEGVRCFESPKPMPLWPDEKESDHSQPRREVTRYDEPSFSILPSPSDNMSPASGHSVSDQRTHCPDYSPLSRPKKSPPPSVEAERTAWEGVVEVLDGLGMGNAGPLIDDAQHRVTPEHVLALIEHWQSRPGAWKIQALHWRIEQARHTKPVDAGWPPVAPRPASVVPVVPEWKRNHLAATEQIRRENPKDVRLRATRPVRRL